MNKEELREQIDALGRVLADTGLDIDVHVTEIDPGIKEITFFEMGNNNEIGYLTIYHENYAENDGIPW